jgi:hypothetical protein
MKPIEQELRNAKLSNSQVQPISAGRLLQLQGALQGRQSQSSSDLQRSLCANN